MKICRMRKSYGKALWEKSIEEARDHPLAGTAKLRPLQEGTAEPGQCKHALLNPGICKQALLNPGISKQALLNLTSASTHC